MDEAKLEDNQMIIQHMVEIYFDMDFGHLPKSEEWVKERFEFFHKYTLNSLHEQTFNDFRIQVLCGETHRKLTESFDWDPSINVVYDSGRNYVETLNADYLAVTRIDSDDMFHKDAVMDVRTNLIWSRVMRRCLTFRKGWTWDMINGFIAPRFRVSPPFYTHVFPKVLFKDWEIYNAQHFIGHGKAGGRLPDTVGLPDFRTCVIRHESNVGYDRRGIKAEKLSLEKIESLRRKFGPDFTTDEGKIRRILNGFGVEL